MSHIHESLILIVLFVFDPAVPDISFGISNKIVLILCSKRKRILHRPRTHENVTLSTTHVTSGLLDHGIGFK